MNDERDELAGLWKSEAVQTNTDGEEFMKQIEKRADCLRRAVRRRNALEYVTILLVAAVLTWMAFQADNRTTQFGDLFVAASSLWIVFYLHRHGRMVKPARPDDCLQAYARSLTENYERQIRLLRGVKYWYLLPMYVGLLIGSLGKYLERPSPRGWIAMLLYTAVFGGVWWLNAGPVVRKLLQARDRVAGMLIE